MTFVNKASDIRTLPPLSMPRNASRPLIDHFGANKEKLCKPNININNNNNTNNNINNNNHVSHSVNTMENNVRCVSVPVECNKLLHENDREERPASYNNEIAALSVKNASSLIKNRDWLRKTNGNIHSSEPSVNNMNNVSRAQSELLTHNNNTNGSSKSKSNTNASDEQILREMEEMFFAQTKRLNKAALTSSNKKDNEKEEQEEKQEEQEVNNFVVNGTKQVANGAIYFKSNDKLSNGNNGNGNSNNVRGKRTSFVNLLFSSQEANNQIVNNASGREDVSSSSPSPSPEQPQVNLIKKSQVEHESHFLNNKSSSEIETENKLEQEEQTTLPENITRSNMSNENSTSELLTQSELELQKLTRELETRQARIQERANTLRKKWDAAHLQDKETVSTNRSELPSENEKETLVAGSVNNSNSNNSSSGVNTTRLVIRPASPQVFHATSDAEIERRAIAAEEFAKNVLSNKHKNKWRHKHQQLSNHNNNSNNNNNITPFDEVEELNELRDYLLHVNDYENDEDNSENSDVECANRSRSSLPSPCKSLHAHKSSQDLKRIGSAHHNQDSKTFANVSSARTSPSPSPRALSAERMRDAAISSTHLTTSSSMTRLSDGAAAIIEMLARRPEIILPAPTETSVLRCGDVLSPQHILKVDLQDALRGRHGSTGMISGAPYFRMVPKLNIAGVAQANQSAIKTIVNELRRAHMYGVIIWINLREEPLVYINNAAHIVRERNDPLKPMIIPNVTGRVIESIEAKLKQEVLYEASENGGNISVYVEGKDGLMEDQWESVDSESVYTLAEVFRALCKQSNRATYYSNNTSNNNTSNNMMININNAVSSSSSSSSSSSLRVRYFRRPITQNLGPQPNDFDFVLNLCLEEPKSVFVFNCQTGRGRTSAMMQIANIVRFYQLCVKDIGVDVRVLRGSANTLPYRTIQKLVSLIPDGKLHERRLMIIMDLSDKIYSMSDHLNEAFATSDSEPEIAVMFLQMYALFLVFSYYCEQRLWNLAIKMSFEHWLNANSDIRLLIESIRGNVEEQLKSENVTAAFSSIGEGGKESEVARIIKQRHGNVLSSGRILCSAPMKSSINNNNKNIINNNNNKEEVKKGVDLTQTTSRQHADELITNTTTLSMEEDKSDDNKVNNGEANNMDATSQLLRQLAPDVPIFTCGRLDKDDRDSLIADIHTAFPELHKIYWLSLRAEAMVIINDISYTLGEYYNYHHVLNNSKNNNNNNNSNNETNTELGTTMHISLAAIEQMEDRLRRDVLLEAQENHGYIILHERTWDNELKTIKVKVRSVRTPKSTMDDFVAESGICYQRVPIPFSGQMLASDLDPLLKYLYESNMDVNDGLVINDSEGFTRTTVVLNLVTVHRAAKLTELRNIETPEDIVSLLRIRHTNQLLPNAYLACNIPLSANEVITEAHLSSVIEVQLASTICQMLTSGSLLRTVDAAIKLGGRGRRWNLLHALDYLKRRIASCGTNTNTNTNSNSSNKAPYITEALHGLRSYLLVLLSSLYMDDQGVYDYVQPFSAWVNERAGVANIINNLDARGEAALKYVSTDNLMKADLSRRNGDVLTANFALKADHFPGCQKRGLRPELCGAPNFRKVNLVNVYGVAIPTIMGIHNVLALLGASNEFMRTYPGQHNDSELYLGFAAPRLFDPSFHSEELQRPLRGSVVWINLREEPILYVGDRPFVFRDLAAPYVNVELTGIQTDKIEQVEEQLKFDVLSEADHYGGKFLVHDEGNPGELVGAWETANENTVKTLREVYGELEAQGFRVRMLRLPVTDEQSPEINDFDLLVNALLPRIAEHLDRRETLSFVFNCQMGRGRTTTGMVICCLLIGLVIPEYYDELHAQYGDLYHDNESEWSKGEYVVITQLKRVLSDGRQAKFKVDLVLEACSRMQNLRTAIESFVLSAASPDNTEEARARAHHSGLHYLIRYFNLIVFAVYLEEEFDRINKRLRRKFVQ